MNVFLAIVLLIVGLIIIVKGGDVFVESAIWFASAAKIPEIIIGATIVSIGTTLPELLTSITSVSLGIANNASESYNAIAIGNSMGSMMCNVGLILAIVILIKPPKAQGKSFKIKAIYLLILSIALTVFSLTGGGLAVFEGIILLILFFVFLAYNLYEAKSFNRQYIKTKMLPNSPKMEPKAIMLNVFQFVIGAIAIAFGAYLLVNNVQFLCEKMGIPTQIIGITVVALGTSLPELVTNLTALKKGNTDIGVGNIIGANIINATLLLGVVTLIGGGINIDYFTKNVAIFAMFAINALLVIPIIIKGRTYKLQGLLLLIAYFTAIILNLVYVIN